MGKFSAVVGLGAALLLAGCALPVRESLRVDLDGDGQAETITLTQGRKEVVVRVEGPALGAQPQTLSFGVDPARQDAICGLPAVLEVTEADCSPEALGSEPLEGCKFTPNAQQISLSDGMCDSIHMYWNNEKRQVWWWRL
jgi:hypothetical protein